MTLKVRDGCKSTSYRRRISPIVRNILSLKMGAPSPRRWLTTPLPPSPVREAWLIQAFLT